MRPTRPHETHRSTTTKFRIDAYDAVVRLAREKRIAITDVMRRGAVLALEEYGAEIPASLSTYVRADAAPLTALDAVDRMMVAAPPALTSRQLTRLVIGLAGRTTLDVQAVRKIAAILLSWTSGCDPALAVSSRRQQRRGQQRRVPPLTARRVVFRQGVVGPSDIDPSLDAAPRGLAAVG